MSWLRVLSVRSFFWGRFVDLSALRLCFSQSEVLIRPYQAAYVILSAAHDTQHRVLLQRLSLQALLLDPRSVLHWLLLYLRGILNAHGMLIISLHIRFTGPSSDCCSCSGVFKPPAGILSTAETAGSMMPTLLGCVNLLLAVLVTSKIELSEQKLVHLGLFGCLGLQSKLL